jgi:hypothetical protein
MLDFIPSDVDAIWVKDEAHKRKFTLYVTGQILNSPLAVRIVRQTVPVIMTDFSEVVAIACEYKKVAVIHFHLHTGFLYLIDDNVRKSIEIYKDMPDPFKMAQLTPRYIQPSASTASLAEINAFIKPYAALIECEPTDNLHANNLLKWVTSGLPSNVMIGNPFVSEYWIHQWDDQINTIRRAENA